MGLMTRFWRWLAIRSAKFGGLPLRDPALVAMFGGQDTTSGMDVNETSALTCSAFWAGVRIISESKAQLPTVTYTETEGGDRKLAVNHPVYELLRYEPNPEMSAFTFHETLQAHCLTWGNGYAEIERDQDKRPLYLWPITPNRVKPGRTDTGDVEYTVAADTELGEDEYTLPARDMFHVPGLGFDGLQGYSVVKQAMESLGISLAAEKYGAGFYGRGSVPSGYIKHPGELGEKAVKNLRESWELMHRGPENSSRVAILDEGMEYKQTTIPPDEAQFLETRQFQVVEIARWLNIPPHMLRDLANATFSNIEQQSLEFLLYTLNPWLERWKAEYRRKLLLPNERRKYSFDHDASVLLKADIKTRFEAYQVARQAGFYSVNDILRRENMNVVRGDEGDALLVPVNMEVLGPKHHPDNQTADVTGDVSITALDGPQVASLLTIMQAVAGNTLRPESAKVLIAAAYPLFGEAQVDAMIAPYMKGNA